MKWQGVLFIVLNLVCISLWSLPKKYNNCRSQIGIKPPEFHNGFFFNESCNRVYVLPPVYGKLELGKPQTTLDQGLCEASLSLLDATQSQMLEIKRYRQELDEYRQQTSPDNQEILAQKLVCKKKDLQKFDLQAGLDKLTAQVEALEKEMEKLIEKKTRCESSSGPDHYSCIQLKTKLQKISDLYQKGEEVLANKRLGLEFAKIDADSCQARLTYLQDLALKDDSKHEELKNTLLGVLRKYDSLLNETLDSESKRPGASFGLNIINQQQKLVDDFKQLNPGVEFVSMPIEKANIRFEMIENGSELGLPILQSANITGFTLEQPGASPISHSELISSGKKEQIEALFGAGVGGSITINRLATCKLLKQANFNSVDQIDIASLIRPTVYYEYSLQVDRKIKVAFAEKHFYQLVKKSTKKKSGLFATKTLDSLTEAATAEKWIDIEFFSETGDHTFTNSIQMAMDIKQEYAQAAISKVATSYLSSGQVNLLEGGENAATGASREIKKCPHVYCQAAGMILDVGSALFAGSTQEAEMRKSVKAMEKLEIKDKTAIRQTSTQVFR